MGCRADRSPATLLQELLYTALNSHGHRLLDPLADCFKLKCLDTNYA
jgi:hypothetical protein